MLLNIIHISPTPLVGSPAQIASAQKKLGHNSDSFLINDYPYPLKGMFIGDSILLVGNEDHFELLIHKIKKADIVHVHNSIPDYLIAKIKSFKHPRFVYHVHSPLREGPLFVSQDQFIDLPFKRKFVVSQYQPRFYPSYIQVPNIVDRESRMNLRKKNDPLVVLFRPSHTRGGRWNSKGTLTTSTILNALQNDKRLKILLPKNNILPDELFDMRSKSHITIDEMVTGGFHMTSLEGLCAGNVVINNADFFSIKSFQRSIFSNEPPPFNSMNIFELNNFLIKLVEDPALTRKLQKSSKKYFDIWLNPRRLAEIYINNYLEII